MKLFIEGDLQIRSDKSQYDKTSIHYEARKKYIDWVLGNKELNNEDTVYISLGDFFELSVPTPRDTAIGIYYLSNLKCKRKIILAGNHDYDRYRKSYSIDPLAEIEGVELIKSVTELEFGDMKTIFLPYYYDFIYEDVGAMKVEYEKLRGTYDYIFHHVEDETQDFGGGKGINLTKLKGERIGGHIHIGGKGYLESPLPNKTNEVLKERHVLLLEGQKVNRLTIPELLRYETVEYPNDIDDFNENTFYTISEVMDKSVALEFYKERYPNIHIKAIKKRLLREFTESEIGDKRVKSIDELWDLFVEKDKIDENVAKIVTNYLSFS